MVTEEIIAQVHAEMAPFTCRWNRFRFVARIALFHICEISELDILDAYLKEHIPEYEEEKISADIDYFRSGFIEWPNPELPEIVRTKCPITATKLDSPQKVRALLKCSQASWIPVEDICNAAEEILYPHEIEKKNSLTISYSSPYKIERNFEGPFTKNWYRSGILERFAFYTQTQYEDLRNVLGFCRASTQFREKNISTWNWQ